jgi:hypothetical protein
MSSITLDRGTPRTHHGVMFPAIASPRMLLLLGTALALVVAAALGDPRPVIAADPDLARLLRGMALIKSVLVLAAVGVLCWRLRQPLAAGHGLAYLVGAWIAAGATMLIWQLSFIVPAALAFHADELLLLLTAWRDGHQPT